jgi:hypothetical protein
VRPLTDSVDVHVEQPAQQLAHTRRIVFQQGLLEA